MDFFLERYNDTMGQRDWISVQDILARKPVCRLDFGYEYLPIRHEKISGSL